MLRKKHLLSILDLVCVALIVATFSVVLFTLLNSQKVAASLISGDDMREISELTRQQQQILLDQTRLTLSLISKMDPEGEECDQELATLLKSQKSYLNFIIADPTGQIICSAMPENPKGNVSGRGYFKRALETGRFTLGEYQISGVTNKPSINFALPYRDQATAISYISIAALNLEWLKHLVDEIDLPPGSEIAIVDDKGIVLARYSDGLIGESAVELTYDMDYVVQAGRELAILKMIDRHGDVRYVAVAPVGIPDQEGLMHILLSVPEENVLPAGLGSVITAFQ